MGLSNQPGISRVGYGVLPEISADPTAISNTGQLYTKDASGVTELYYESSDGTVTQLTCGGVPVVNYWNKSGTNLSPVTAGDDVLLNAGESLTITDMTAGSVLFAGTSGLVSQDNASLFFDNASNELGIGTTSPDTKLHVHIASAGTVTALAGSAITAESNTDTYLQFLTPNTNEQGILFGDPDSTVSGQLSYQHATDTMIFYTAAIERMKINATSTVFNEGSTDTDFRVESDGNANMLFLDAGNNKVAIGTATAVGTLTVNGGISAAIVTKTFADTGYTATTSDHTILCNAVGGNMTINLPAVASSTGLILNIKKIDASANTVTVDASGAELIDGAATQVISSQWTNLKIQCDGSAWYIL